ncbi:ABC transporter ATP-binding protein [Janibacter sp. G349]|uniref:ABC transporter ATP-binding protein n=1 Tax=Janibacter sp. G349 TaxID=3405424 RepID=UPI003B7C48BD
MTTTAEDAPQGLLSVQDLVVEFPAAGGRTVHAVSGVSLEVHRGETLGIVGESGCGKSTTARAMVMLRTPTSGMIEFDGTSLVGLRPKELRRLRPHLQMIFQDPVSSLNPHRKVRDIVAEGMTVWGRPVTEEWLDALLSEVGLEPDEVKDRYPSEFSGGQCQRIAIARALALEPELLVCDEAVSALDVSVQAQVLNLLHDLKERRGLTMVFISHDLAVVRNVCDRVAVMYLGKVVEETTVDALFAQPYHPYTSALLEAVPEPDPTLPVLPLELYGEAPSPLDPPSGCRFRTRCRHAQDICATEEPPLLTVADQHKVACHLAEDMPELLALPTMTA